MKFRKIVCIRDPVREISVMPNPVTAFEKDYENTPDRIYRGNFTHHSSAVKSLIAPSKWDGDPAISALLGLNDR